MKKIITALSIVAALAVMTVGVGYVASSVTPVAKACNGGSDC